MMMRFSLVTTMKIVVAELQFDIAIWPFLSRTCRSGLRAVWSLLISPLAIQKSGQAVFLQASVGLVGNGPFNRTFKRIAGTSPGHYRRSHLAPV